MSNSPSWVFAFTCLIAAGLAQAQSAVEIADQNGCKTVDNLPAPNKTLSWSGGCKDGWLDGRGTIEWKEDGTTTYVGEITMVRGQPNGNGKINNLKSKWSYEGDMLNGKFHGYGQFRNIANGVRYVGEFWEGKEQGLGTLYFPSGNRQEGQFSDGKAEGFAVTTTASGIRIQGTVSGGDFNGPGIQTFADGERVETTFSGGLWELGADCQDTWSNGSVFGKIVIDKKNGKKLCDRTLGGKISHFFDITPEQANALAAGGKPQSTPFAALNQLAQAQATQLQAQQMQAQAQQMQVQIQSSLSKPFTSPQNEELAQLRAQLAEKDRQLASAGQQPSLARAGASETQTQLTPSRPVSQPKSSFVHGDRYESDGQGGLIYVAYVRNDGEVALSCDFRVSGLVWSSAATNTNLQNNYSDRRTALVYPGREGTAGFSRVVAKSGSYQVNCAHN
jgi:hypothetical protein